MKTVIAGLEEGLNAIAEALEGGGGGGGNVPTPTLDDDGKVLKVVSQSQEEVAPEWATVREVPAGGRNGQVLTKNSDGYGWAAPAGGLPSSTSSDYGKVLTVDNHGDPDWATPEKELPSISSGDSGKVLRSWYDSEEGYGYSRWDTIASVPSSNASDSGKILTCTGRNAYGWAPASGGGHIDVVKFDIAKAQFSQDGDMYKVYASTEDPNIATKINHIISMSIVDDIDENYPDLINPATGEFSIYYEDELVTIKISSTIYEKLGTRGNNYFYMTYYTGA